MKSTNIVWADGYATQQAYEERNGHRGVVLWFTGLSGAGKSTLAKALQKHLFETGYQVTALDGDNVRHGLNRDLSFSAEDRTENIRRISEVAKLFKNAGFITITAFISPYRSDRGGARNIVGEGDFLEVFVKADLDVCIQRDPKGLYKKALNNEIPKFTGISDPYEAPENPEVTVDTTDISVEEGVAQIVNYLADNGYIPKPA